jgi:outer membrane protein TolC
VLDVQQAHQNVLAEEGRYPYVFQADAGFTRTVSPRLGPDDSVTSSTSRSYTVGSALRRTFPIGTSAELRVQGERFERDSVDPLGSSVGNGYGVTARASVTQPLMRGAGLTVGELELRAARASRVVAEKGRARETSELVRGVLNAYWELWYADEAIGIENAALGLAQRQESEAQQQVAAGASAPADVLTFSTERSSASRTDRVTRAARRSLACRLDRARGARSASESGSDPR